MKPAAPKPGKPGALSRIKLALLDAYCASGEKKGYDPYNTVKGNPPRDQWWGNARRI